MPWWRVEELVIDFGLPGVMALVGLGLVFGVGFRKWRRKPARRCFKCGYDMRATAGLVCPECGYEARSQREVEHGRVRRWAVWVGLVILLPVVWLVGALLWDAPWTMERVRTDRRVMRDRTEWDTKEVLFELSGRSVGITYGSAITRTGWRAQLLNWLVGGSWYPLAHSYATKDIFVDRVVPVLDPNVIVTPVIEPGWRKPTVYAAHALLFPGDHYRSYLYDWDRVDGPAVVVRKVVIVPGRYASKELTQDALDSLSVYRDCEDFLIWGLKVDARLFEAMRGMKLKRVDLDHFTGNIDGLANFEGIERVRLSFDRKIGEADFDVLRKLKKLNMLKLEGVMAKEPGVDMALARMVEGSSVVILRLDIDGMDPKVFEQMKVPATVKYLTMTGWKPRDAACERLCQMNLEDLEVRDVSEKGLETLMGNGGSMSLKLYQSKLPKGVVEQLKVKYPGVLRDVQYEEKP